MQALGLRWADLFSGARPAREHAAIAVYYPYHDRQGQVVAQKVRFAERRLAHATVQVEPPMCALVEF